MYFGVCNFAKHLIAIRVVGENAWGLEVYLNTSCWEKKMGKKHHFIFEPPSTTLVTRENIAVYYSVSKMIENFREIKAKIKTFCMRIMKTIS